MQPAGGEDRAALGPVRLNVLRLRPVGGMAPRSAAWTRGARALRERMSRLRGWAFAASLVAGVAFAGLLELTSTLLPLVSGAPTTDPWFGAANACVTDALSRSRLGFAVSPDGSRIAGFDSRHVAICERAGGSATVLNLEPMGELRALSFDGQGALWLSAEAPDAGLLRWTREAGLTPLGALSTRAMVGTRGGVVLLEAEGRLSALDSAGQPNASRLLEPAPQRVLGLVSSPDGLQVALIADGGVLVLDAASLEPLRAEAPCDVQGAIFTASPGQLLLVCGPEQSWALQLDVASGHREAVPLPRPLAVMTLPNAGRHVQACDHLPCTVAISEP